MAPRRCVVAATCRRRIRASRLMCCVSQESPVAIPIRLIREKFKRLPLANVDRPPSIDAKTRKTQPGRVRDEH